MFKEAMQRLQLRQYRLLATRAQRVLSEVTTTLAQPSSSTHARSYSTPRGGGYSKGPDITILQGKWVFPHLGTSIIVTREPKRHKPYRELEISSVRPDDFTITYTRGTWNGPDDDTRQMMMVSLYEDHDVVINAPREPRGVAKQLRREARGFLRQNRKAIQEVTSAMTPAKKSHA